MKILSLFINPQVVPDLNDLISSVEHKRRNLNNVGLPVVIANGISSFKKDERDVKA